MDFGLVFQICVNILYQLGVFFDIQRKTNFCNSLIVSALFQ